MRGRFEFQIHYLSGEVEPHIDPTIALLGSQGWELRGIAARADGSIAVALQRPLDEEVPLPERGALAATLEAPLAAPSSAELGAA